jgi:FtsH-binding integral membrane protein
MEYAYTNPHNQGDFAYGDIEEPNAGFKYDAQTLRLGFIRKVYLILSTQLVLTAALIAVSVSHDQYRLFVKANPWLLITCGVVAIITLYALVCYSAVSRRTPWNYMLLFLFTGCEAYMASCITAYAPPQTVLIAAILTAVVVVALTIYAFTTKTDFTVLGGILFVAVMLLFVAGILAIFIRNKILDIVISSLACLVYGVYLIFDTQLVVGKHENALSLDDYIQGALQLYIDILRLFIEILRILAAVNNNN